MLSQMEKRIHVAFPHILGKSSFWLLLVTNLHGILYRALQLTDGMQICYYAFLTTARMLPRNFQFPTITTEERIE